MKMQLQEKTKKRRLNTKVSKLLYICDKPDASPSLIHITFLLENIGGEIRFPSNEFDYKWYGDGSDPKTCSLWILREFYGDCSKRLS